MLFDGNVKFDWNKGDRIEFLKRLWEQEGRTANEIMGWFEAYLEPGESITRSAVIGKIHRLGLIKKITYRKPVKKKKKDRKVNLKSLKLKKLPQVSNEPIPINNGLLDIMHLNEHTCRWPIGDPVLPNFGFCGAYKDDVTTSYCLKHTLDSRQVSKPRVNKKGSGIYGWSR